MMQPAFKQHFVVSSGVTSGGLTIGLLDTITVLAGGTMSSIQITDGGIATISSGGTAVVDTVSSGGVEDVLAGGLADLWTSGQGPSTYGTGWSQF